MDLMFWPTGWTSMMVPVSCCRVYVWEWMLAINKKRATGGVARCTKWTMAILWRSVTVVTFHLLLPIFSFCTPLSISQGYKMVQRTSEKRRNGRMKRNVTLYCHYYLYILLHTIVRRAVGHQGKGPPPSCSTSYDSDIACGCCERGR